MNYPFLKQLGIHEKNSGVFTQDAWLQKPSGSELVAHTPIDGSLIAHVQQGSKQDLELITEQSVAAFHKWRMLPAPQRGEIVRQIGNALREHKQALGQLVTLEMGKILQEGLGEVQEMIDICDFACGLSRQLYGLTMHSERPMHRMYEQWHPLGPVGVITAFNFPVAVWAWNACIAAVCGDTVIWKPSQKTPLCAIAVQNIVEKVMKAHGHAGVFTMIVGNNEDVGENLIADKRIPLISATGSTRMGRHVGEAVAKRLGKSLLELGGNNAIIIAKDANLDMAVRATLFGAVGTSGQRCTSTRRIYVEKEIETPFITALQKAYTHIRIGNPLDEKNLMGPLIDNDAVKQMQNALIEIKKEGGEILYGGETLDGKEFPGECYVKPCIVHAKKNMKIMQEETFAPILYITPVNSIDEAVSLQNDVPQGLSSAIFTNSFSHAEAFLSHKGSDCGIANVNIGTSGAEIGGAFGGEKDTGGGRESGSDAWKTYMRRQTCTLNWGNELPLAQGIKFDSGK
ncbi:MAG: aldehyde dehydrogenase family protein [Deltaproteobacteria bacterium CG_4_10_14_0_2_um_filter_43_8]|nr:MAG: aldehyde dehydrogenase family protein [Deltaproteobacteria bacterium CG11_big_fil_rev_8_21_14_0_20_42_23]PJA21158.1 MAG: aldehyde dehydrogenase family protein [Deltaproteobacteria bacterium CG_4_10_14_0_2_um_filter_43_8]PJC65185.1 MAG: aldehyde dehydrogenase family protein [Deltaproteobacteria bacterium CG_4_9_14_0_2_um_filter_42_21]